VSDFVDRLAGGFDRDLWAALAAAVFTPNPQSEQP
jgi:hypothetical protein